MKDKIPTDYDRYLFHQGSHYKSYEFLGAHPCEENGKTGVRFSVWAPNAAEVRVIGSFNNWDGNINPMERINDSGIWTTFIPEAKKGDLYKYEILTKYGDTRIKSDPYAFYAERKPKTASIVYSLNNYKWNDKKWMDKKKDYTVYNKPVLIYEVHLGSWKRKENGDYLTYRELANELVEYVKDMGYNYIELLPVAEHPFDGSWGYQLTNYYSVTSRYGTPEDFMYFIDKCHQNGIGVILDWVPGHFCKDDHGLRLFDGTALYEPQDPRKAENEWDTLNFDFNQPEVWSFLISNAVFWFDIYHIDGLRVDAVSNLLYLNHGKGDGEWVPNKYGGHENLEAIDFIKTLNKVIFEYFPNPLMIAEESSAWPLVTYPAHLGGLGFNYKWNMGWMNDTLEYMEMDSIYRKYHHNLLTFSFMYMFSENFVLPLSHDEVVHGKKSLLDKMPGDYWQKFANLRTLYGYMMGHPGKKLLFMGGEFGQFIEWNYKQGLDWLLLDYDMHKKLQNYVRELNYFYRQEKTLWEGDHEDGGFEWIDPHDSEQSIITFMRKNKDGSDYTIIVCNFTPEVRHNYRIGVPEFKEYKEVFNSDLEKFGGSGQKNSTIIQPSEQPWHNRPYSIEITIPPLATIFFKPLNQ
ncbi:1,4-alpha-glucan branching protein GlgB [Halothermothrix orenii]|uniref:1,4-alpha-glucan branching enzyme GlgB n=1 Tax=Halothermothrix orenii (strain H 168 / OCM 544 / DSM 9562) TaxID=373903 RepID=GLGB_HALOH|nr:1,4-alpha-glucan branching protein GlgB [Halothermothrix orenii]B8CVY1.1 RecName: Full=1,4-alpha-glucan branching enzyme GlgB; AltName: Full=1,4-alpha-D-glucan:1,4-alpha-D-glucan 6-glucosyl-transferase; AltName: Full=Alpha-(1->4)-glucan branching enzyme; AltName: Full=Glycogen branching enzyme; Short=BE [Halothermothrix orenii H 168]ACL69450.1 1,4-alpha-glucan branching enzyme [Halothermothrix orenii H 168]